MKKYLLTEIIISAIYTVCMPQLWDGGIGGYMFYAALVFAIPFLFGYMFALVCFLICYIASLIFKTKLPKLNKIAFIGFWIVFVGLACVDVYKIYLKNERHNAKSNIEETTQKDNTSANKKAVSSDEVKEMHQYMRGVLNTIVKDMDKKLASYTDRVNIPEPMFDTNKIVDSVSSKEKLNAAINKQDMDIKRYKEDTKTIFDDVMNNNVNFAFSECIKKYKRDNCEKTMKPFKSTLVKMQDKNYEFVQLYIDALEEELSAMRFINDHYDKFRVTDKGPYFTDPALQKYFMTKIQEVGKKYSIFFEEASKLEQNSLMPKSNSK